MKEHNYFVYITTNPNRSVLYTGVTNDLERRITEHYLNRGNKTTFTGRYYAYCLVYYERYQHIYDAIDGEKEIKGWVRQKKEELITEENPRWRFLNEEVCSCWPPPGSSTETDR